MSNGANMEWVRRDAEMIARNILSGKNECGDLMLAVNTNDIGYFVRCAAPVLKVRHEECAMAASDAYRRAVVITDLERRLEFVRANAPEVYARMEKELA